MGREDPSPVNLLSGYFLDDHIQILFCGSEFVVAKCF
jgi:hypothetical protein